MRAAAYIKSAEKTHVDMGSWKSGTRMPKNAIGTRKPYPVTGSWTWRLIKFKCDGEPYKILLKHRKERADFMAMLVHDPGDATVLCRVEHHGSHPGWHVHYQAHAPYITGPVITPNDKVRRCGKDSPFGSNVLSGFDAWAMTVAAGLFGLHGDSMDGFGELS